MLNCLFNIKVIDVRIMLGKTGKIKKFIYKF